MDDYVSGLDQAFRLNDCGAALELLRELGKKFGKTLNAVLVDFGEYCKGRFVYTGPPNG